MVRRSLALRFVRLPTECFVPTSHKLSLDGYFRYHFGGRTSSGGIALMFHRAMWEDKNGPVPEGHEINHLCNKRACCNVTHMECITRTEHLVKTNEVRYLARHVAAKAHWLRTKCTGTSLASAFEVTVSQACRWIRSWNLATH